MKREAETERNEEAGDEQFAVAYCATRLDDDGRRAVVAGADLAAAYRGGIWLRGVALLVQLEASCYEGSTVGNSWRPSAEPAHLVRVEQLRRGRGVRRINHSIGGDHDGAGVIDRTGRLQSVRAQPDRGLLDSLPGGRCRCDRCIVRSNTQEWWQLQIAGAARAGRDPVSRKRHDDRSMRRGPSPQAHRRDPHVARALNAGDREQRRERPVGARGSGAEPHKEFLKRRLANGGTPHATAIAIVVDRDRHARRAQPSAGHTPGAKAAILATCRVLLPEPRGWREQQRDAHRVAAALGGVHRTHVKPARRLATDIDRNADLPHGSLRGLRKAQRVIPGGGSPNYEKDADHGEHNGSGLQRVLAWALHRYRAAGWSR